MFNYISYIIELLHKFNQYNINLESLFYAHIRINFYDSRVSVLRPIEN